MKVLYSTDNTDGPFLEDLLDDVISDLYVKQERERCRETSIIITKLEEAAMWQRSRMSRKDTERG